VKFYNSLGPNPKLVRMFAAEKGYAFDSVEQVDLMSGANRKEPYLAKNPAGQVPCVELPDGRFIAETIAICELIEEKQPRPALIGTTPEDRAETRMWVRRVEWKITQPLADGFRFAEGLPLFKDRIRTLPEAADGLKSVARDGLAWLDAQLAGRDTIVPGRFTLADIALFAFLEFGAAVKQSIDPSLASVQNWFAKTAGRPSAKA
jgi:glutathione S-transferase